MSFIHDDLDALEVQIRVLTIVTPRKHKRQPGPPAPDTKLNCTLDVISLDDDDAAKFNALSYVWGDSTSSTNTISINGKDIHVTKNLHSALQWIAAQCQGDSRLALPVWADAICINQYDLDEKSSQIGLMSRIYQEAKRTICWLGTSTPPIEKFLRWKPVLSRSTPGAGLGAMREAFFTCSMKALGKSKQDREQEMLEIIAGQTDFIRLEYFRRMWTLQESLLPGNRTVFVLGGRVIDHSIHSFKSVPIPLTDWVLQKHDRDDRSKDKSVSGESTLPAIWNPAYLEARMAAGTAMADAKFLDISWRQRRKGYKLFELLLAASDRVCQDPRDKIFAALGLFGDPGAEGDIGEKRDRASLLVVDYAKPPKQVVRDALCYIFRNEGALSAAQVILRFEPWTQEKTPPNEHSNYGEAGRFYPTWLPDLLQARKPFHPPIRDSMLQNTDITWTTEGPTHRDVLRYEARRVGVVQACSAFLGSPVDIIDKFAYILQALVQGHRPAAKGGNSPGQRPTASADDGIRHKHCDIDAVISQVRSEHLLLTMLIDPQNTMKDPQFFEYLTQPGADVWSELQNAIRSPPSCGVITSQVEGPLRRAGSIAELLRGRTLFVLDDGNIGLCPDRVCVGDVLFFAPPFSDCLLLRSTGTSSSNPASRRDGSQKPESPQDGSRTYEFIACPYVHGLSYNPSRNPEFEERVYGMDSEPIRMI